MCHLIRSITFNCMTKDQLIETADSSLQTLEITLNILMLEHFLIRPSDFLKNIQTLPLTSLLESECMPYIRCVQIQGAGSPKRLNFV